MECVLFLKRLCVTGLAVSALLLTACGSLSSPNSPDVVYSETAVQARELQVPPDLTDISNAEQFVVPGTDNTAISRNTLLPQIESVRFVREGGQSWLEFQQTPENLWPQLLGFLRDENYVIEQTEPVSGLIVSEWRAVDVPSGAGILRSLVGSDESFTRVAFRLERAGGGARLFARSQAAESKEALEEAAGSDKVWPASSHDPESTSELLNRFLAYLGVEQQKVRGILGEEQAKAVLEDAVVQRNAAGSEILVNRGFASSFERVQAALQALSLPVSSSDADVGRIEFMDAQTPLVIRLSPVHVSAVRLLVSDSDGGRLSAEREQQLLSLLAEQLG